MEVVQRVASAMKKRIKEEREEGKWGGGRRLR
jgi:hypothetical protein